MISPQRGFTLIELGVVLAVMSVMAAVLVPDFIESTRNQLAERTVEQVMHIQDSAKWFLINSSGDPEARRWPGQPDPGQCSAVDGLVELHSSQMLSSVLSTNPWGHPYLLSVSGAPASCSFVTSTMVPDGIALMTASLLPAGQCTGCLGGPAPDGWTRCCSTIPRPGFEASLAGLRDQLLQDVVAELSVTTSSAPASGGGGAPEEECTRGTFCNDGGRVIEWMCNCGGVKGGSGWVLVGGWCYHRFTNQTC